MSRIVIKNLPKKITESKIREIFGEKGNITDVQLKYTSDGKFRQFAFVGYHDEKEATEAIQFFNNTYISTNKVIVQICAQLGDIQKPKAWSKYSSDAKPSDVKQAEVAHNEEINSKKKSKKKVKKIVDTDLLQKYKNEPQFEEFMELHGTLNKNISSGIEINADVDNNPENDSSNDDDGDVDPDAPKLALQKISDLEYMKSLVNEKSTNAEKDSNNVNVSKSTLLQSFKDSVSVKLQLFTLKLRDLPYNCKKKNIKEFLRPIVPFSIRIPRKIKGIAYVGFKTEKKFKQALLKDRSFINGKRISVMEYNVKNNTVEDEINPSKVKWKSQEDALKNEEDIAESGKIFVRNLTYTTTEEDVNELFSKYGPITEMNLPIDPTSRKPKGFGVITFLMPEHAVKAYSELDGSILHGRMLHLLPAKSKDAPEENLQDSSNYKQKKNIKQKAQAGSAHNWNSLFLGHDAVAEVIAKTYGTSKENVLNTDDKSSAAVRLALGETQIVATTRKYLEDAGVCLDAFSEVAGKRSKTLILVKNLPSETEPRELRELFEKFGVIGRIILPPSGITALVEFVEPSEARKAFINLAYSKFKHLPLYLEWAAENSLLQKKSQPTQAPNKQAEELCKDIVNDAKEDIIEDEGEEEEPEPDTTLFVKNLNFKTSNDDLKKHFECCGKIHYATVATKKDKSDPKNMLSMGYGFVRYYHKTSIEKALKILQCSTLDGKTLELKRSERTLQNDVKTNRKSMKASKQNGTKLLIRNVPFQANQNEIMELFKTFGEIKAVRLPKKMSGEGNAHRGFAFVDYFTTSDAKQAFEALSQSTHLYGRRLVLEWASTEEGVEEIRKRTADHFHSQDKVISKKSVLDFEKI